MLQGNFILMQDYMQDDYLKYMQAWLECEFDFMQFQLPQMDEKIALSWHLTEKEKQFLKYAVFTPENQESLKRAEHYSTIAGAIRKLHQEISRQPDPAIVSQIDL